MKPNLLKAKMKEYGDTQESLAFDMGVSPSHLNYKINDKIDFRTSEVKFIINRYHLTNDELKDIFFD